MNKQNSSRHTSRYYGDETSHYDRYSQAKSLCATSYKVIRVIRAKRRMQGPFKFEICKWCALLGNLQIGGSHITPIINLYLFLVSKSIFCRSMKGHTCMVTDLESKSFQPGITQTPSHTHSNARTQTDRQTSGTHTQTQRGQTEPGITQTPSHTHSNARTQTDRQTDIGDPHPNTERANRTTDSEKSLPKTPGKARNSTRGISITLPSQLRCSK